jgi:hypothetical protein
MREGGHIRANFGPEFMFKFDGLDENDSQVGDPAAAVEIA